MLNTAKLWLDVAVAVVIFAILGLLLWQYEQHKLDVAHMDALSTQLSTQSAVLASVQAGQVASDQAIHDMAGTLAAASAHGGVVRSRVVTMGKNNATLTQWLDAPIPDPAGCMLDDSCAGASAPGAR
jgi:hypothetical protein